MKKLAELFVFPGVPYPLGAVLHIVIGAAIGAIASQLLDSADAERAALWAEIGAVVGVVVGFVLWLWVKPANLNKRG